MYNLSKSYLKKILNFVLILAMILCLLGFLTDLRNTIKFGFRDFRNRVVAARVLIRGLDPYYFKWQPGIDERLLDPNNEPNVPVSRATVPPTVLLFHSIFAEIPYLYQKFIWLLWQWFCFISALMLLISHVIQPLQKKFLLIAGLLLVAANLFWRAHVEAGQIYVLYVALLAASYWRLTKKIKLNDISGGLLIGLAASLRLPIIIMVLPMLLFKKFKLLAATIFGFCLCLLASLLIVGQGVWQSYFSAMKVNGQLNTGSITLTDSQTIYPPIVEGMNNLRTQAYIMTSDSSIQTNLHKIFNLNLQANSLLVILSLVLLVISGLIYGLFTKNKQIKAQIPDVDLIFIFGTIMILIVEVFIPAPRYSYNDIQFLIPLILLLKQVDFLNYRHFSWAILLIGSVCMTNGLFSWFPKEIILGQFLTIATMILMSLSLLTRKPVSLTNTTLSPTASSSK